MRVRGASFLVLALLLGACGGGDGSAATTTAAPSTTAVPSTTSTTAPTTTTSTVPPAVMPVFADDAEPVPVDPGVLVGQLDNGLTYYVRENTRPGGRAELRLVVRAGSVHEADDQAGVAHFLEHMMFNGTAAFPANEITAVLERFGAEFGPDLNGYSSYEETVFRVNLPTDDPAIIEAALDVLRQWATEAALDPGEIDLERGVLVEEWRLLDQGFYGRYDAAVSDLLLADTPYADRLPLGSPEEIEAVTREQLQDFYGAWYRPDLMAVVAVGDFDGAAVEQLIVERFADIAEPADPRPAPELFTVPFTAPEILVLADPEAPYSFVELNYPVPVVEDVDTVGAIRRRLALDAAWEMLSTRVYEDTLRGLVPCFDPSRAANEFVRTQLTDGLWAFANPGDLAVTAQALLSEVERARRFGFGVEELARAADDLRADVAGEYEAFGSKQDMDFADDYVGHFLGDFAAAEAGAWRSLRLRLIDELTPEQVRDTFAATIQGTHPLVIVAGPEAMSDSIPTAPELQAIAAAVASTDLAPRADEAPGATELLAAPDPAEAVGRSSLPETVVPVLAYGNGLRFTYLVSDIHRGHATLFASSPGGWAKLDPEDVAEARLLGDLMGASGVGAFDQVTLERLLTGREVYLVPYVGEAWEGFDGFAASDDLEALFQLAHLYMTDPRFDPMAVGLVQNRLRQAVEAPETLADVALDLEIAAARFAGDARFAPFPTPEELASLDLERAAAVFADRFGDPADFVFVLVGDFTPRQAEDLAARYLGTIPGGTEQEEFTAVRPDAPDALVDRTVEAGTGSRGAVTMLFSTDQALTPAYRVHLDVLEAVINQRLIAHIREELSASYAPAVAFELIDDPEGQVEALIRVDGDPVELDAIAAALLADLADLVENGPTADELAIGREQIFRNYQLFDNPGLATAMLGAAHDPDRLLGELWTRIERVGAVSAADIRDAARRVLTLDAYILVRLVPIGFGE